MTHCRLCRHADAADAVFAVVLISMFAVVVESGSVGRQCVVITGDVTRRRDDVISGGVNSAASTSSGDADAGLRATLLTTCTRPVTSLIRLDRLRLRQQLDRQSDVAGPRPLLAAAASAAARGRPDRSSDGASTLNLAVTGLVQPTLSESAKRHLLAASTWLCSPSYHRRV